MNLFYKAEAVRLKSYHKKYLHAEEDGESVSQDRSSTSNNNRWTVEIVRNHDGSPFFIRLKSCYNKYLTASDQPFLLGMTGCKVLQTALPPHELSDSSIDWEPIREGNQVRLKTNKYSHYLRANGGIPPWRNSITHDDPFRESSQDVLWDVYIVELGPFNYDSFSFSEGNSSTTTNIPESIRKRSANVALQSIKVATKNFTSFLGNGGYGLVYKGELLISGKAISVAVKRLQKTNHSGQGLKEFLTEIQLLSSYKHPNLVALVGFCQEDGENILIYEYAPHGSLDSYLRPFKTSCPLTWRQRVTICLDAARGLDYLHNVPGNQRVIHRDIKSGNILLDQNWKAKIADLGLSKLGCANEGDSYLITNVSGTSGYCDPVYIDTGILTKESDVYSFGILPFEVLSGRLCFMNVNNEQRFLLRQIQHYNRTGKLEEIVDPDLKNNMDLNSVKEFSAIAYRCLHEHRSSRPSMGLVVQKLEKTLELLVSSS